MADESKMIFVRPRNCQFCGHGFYGLAHAVNHAQQVGAWSIIDLTHEQANKEPVYNALDAEDPAFFYMFGHGNDCLIVGDAEQNVFTCDECDRLNGRIVYLLSCLTANGLGLAIMEQGAVAYAGFDISWTWLSDSDPNGDNDPYDDPYAHGFWESANELWIAFTDGNSFKDSVDASITRYNDWIDYWFYDNPEDPGAEECIKWLVHDRNGLVAFGEGLSGSPRGQKMNAVAVSAAVIAMIGIGWYLLTQTTTKTKAKRA